MFFYFRRIKVFGIENIPKNKSVLLLSNHQNALLDALLIATKSNRYSYFLTRAGVFQKPFVAKLLKSLQMLPVYRVRDGWGNLSNNNAIFETCSELLNKKECVVIFPEGNHNLMRRVRPLSKGFTRIVLNTFEKYPNIDLQLLPVGLNYQDAVKFPDSTAIYFGKTIEAKNYISGDKNNDVVSLKSKIQSEISQLTTNIPKDDYEVILGKLKLMETDFLNPKAVNACIDFNFKDCKIKKVRRNMFLEYFSKFLLILIFPIPYILWKFLIKPRIKEIEFLSTFRFAAVVTLAPVWLIILFLAFGVTLSWSLASLCLIAIIIISIVAVKA
ncbi:glycerol acyltransferase [Algibacter marinivivus]|uniref:Glycerol acyltransferase n=2 Tax=Algibacter marinivivus TaxID=2100723 RepID=A0A2U2X520_9FLAO|nr:glycerol acyltransferase [Algibacter marinivivus]